MTLKQGWINRQFARVERDAKNWPDWMQRETQIRAQKNKNEADSDVKRTVEPQTPAAKGAGGA
jgi:hypothetical protein